MKINDTPSELELAKVLKAMTQEERNELTQKMYDQHKNLPKLSIRLKSDGKPDSSLIVDTALIITVTHSEDGQPQIDSMVHGLKGSLHSLLGALPAVIDDTMEKGTWAESQRMALLIDQVDVL